MATDIFQTVLIRDFHTPHAKAHSVRRMKEQAVTGGFFCAKIIFKTVTDVLFTKRAERAPVSVSKQL